MKLSPSTMKRKIMMQENRIRKVQLNNTCEQIDKNIQHLNWTHVGDMTHILVQLKQLNGEE
jgi:hypothetical protein